MEDKRQFIRLNETFPVRFKFIKSALGMSARSQDICEDGLRVCGLQKIHPGTPIKLDFHLPEDKNQIMALGEVMWQSTTENAHHPSTMGIQFVDISPDDRDRIKEYIIHRISQNLNSKSVYETA